MRELSELAAAVWHAAQPAPARRALRELSALALRVTLASVDRRRALSLAELASCLLLLRRHRSPRRRRRARRQRRVPVANGSSRSGRDVRRTARADARRAFPGARPAGTPEPARAALDAGFGSYSQFHRIFTRVSGSRPRDYLQGGRQRTALLVSGDRSSRCRAQWSRCPMSSASARLSDSSVRTRSWSQDAKTSAPARARVAACGFLGSRSLHRFSLCPLAAVAPAPPAPRMLAPTAMTGAGTFQLAWEDNFDSFDFGRAGRYRRTPGTATSRSSRRRTRPSRTESRRSC